MQSLFQLAQHQRLKLSEHGLALGSFDNRVALQGQRTRFSVLNKGVGVVFTQFHASRKAF
jgi:DNA polymerase/3'-5' exonuclease PolX